MAEMDLNTGDDLDMPGPDGETDAPDTPSEPAEGTTDTDALGDEPPSDPNDPNYKYWQGAYTRARQRDRAQVNTIQSEHQQWGEVLRNFHTDDAYALQVLRSRFPHLAAQLSLPGQAGTTPHARSQVGTTPEGKLEMLLAEQLGPDLQFLAPKLAGALHTVLHESIEAAVTPLKQETQQQQAAARKREEDALLADMDQKHPGWDTRYADDMKTLDAFLASDALMHPKFGNKYELLLRLVNPDVARIDATRQMQTAARSRLTTGRPGRQGQPNVDDEVRKAPTSADAFMLAAQAALRTLRSA